LSHVAWPLVLGRSWANMGRVERAATGNNGAQGGGRARLPAHRGATTDQVAAAAAAWLLSARLPAAWRSRAASDQRILRLFVSDAKACNASV
jgi:hypothetical protein